MTETLATQRLQKVETLAEKLGLAESMLETGYAELATSLLAVQENRDWEGQYESWGDYFQSVVDRHKMGKAQLYHKLSCVKQLREAVPAADLTAMGISKASVLAEVHRSTGQVPETVLQAAKEENTTVKELRRVLAEATHAPERPNDQWVELDFSSYWSDSELAEYREAEQAARMMDPPISNTLKTFQQRKEVLLRFVREFLATYPADPYDQGSYLETEKID